MARMHGSSILADWLAANSLSEIDFAESVEASRQTIHRWLRRQVLPSPAMRWCIARATDGAVPAESWLTDRDRAAIARVPSPPPSESVVHGYNRKSKPGKYAR